MFIVESLKEFQNIKSGQQIKVYTDHWNLTYKTYNTERVIQLILILQEYRSKLIYIQGSNNIAAYALSRLDIVDTPNPVTNNS